MTNLSNPECTLCLVKLDNFECLRIHMTKAHNESDHDRIERLYKTFSSHPSSVKEDNKSEEKMDNVCELCEKILPNKVQKNNHKLFQHTVKADKIKCEFCNKICDGLMNLCSHISCTHAELFPKMPNRGNCCDMCFARFENSEELDKHKLDIHSPDSFYEKLVEDISGECRICKKIVNQNELENHFKSEHISYIETRSKPKVKDDEVCFVLEEVLDKVIELSDNDEEDEIESVEEDEINIEYDYSIEKSKGDESFKGKKPLFVQAVKAFKQLLMEKGDKNGKIINNHKMVVKDAREVSYGMEADIEITTGKMKGLARAKIWGPSKSSTKKNRCTILIERYPNSEIIFATKLSRKIVKPLLDTYLKGLGWKNIMKKSTINITDRVQCFDCEKSFGKGYIKTHMIKMHKTKCSLCNKTFQREHDLRNHTKNVHEKSELDFHRNTKQSEIIITPTKFVSPVAVKNPLVKI